MIFLLRCSIAAHDAIHRGGGQGLGDDMMAEAMHSTASAANKASSNGTTSRNTWPGRAPETPLAT
jgi:hypothetical protein